MEKYAVVTDEELIKSASVKQQGCPSCGSTFVNYSGSTPHCPKCGTEPWENRGKSKKVR